MYFVLMSRACFLYLSVFVYFFSHGLFVIFKQVSVNWIRNICITFYDLNFRDSKMDLEMKQIGVGLGKKAN